MSKSKKPQTKASKAKTNFAVAAKKASAKIREKSEELIHPAANETAPETASPETPKKPKVNKKQLMLDMLKRSEGVSITELEKATGWQSHSVRGALVNLKNKDKHPITNGLDDTGVRRYQLSQPAEQLAEGSETPTQAAAQDELAE